MYLRWACHLSSLSCRDILMFSLTLHCIYCNFTLYLLKLEEIQLETKSEVMPLRWSMSSEMMVPFLSAGCTWSLQGAAGGQGGAGVPQKVCRPHWAHSAGKSQRRHRLCRHPSIQGESGTDGRLQSFCSLRSICLSYFSHLYFQLGPTSMWCVLTIELTRVVGMSFKLFKKLD